MDDQRWSFFKVADDTGPFYRYCDRVDVSSSSDIVGFIGILSYSIFVYQFVLLCNYGVEHLERGLVQSDKDSSKFCIFQTCY